MSVYSCEKACSKIILDLLSPANFELESIAYDWPLVPSWVDNGHQRPVSAWFCNETHKRTPLDVIYKEVKFSDRPKAEICAHRKFC